MKDKELSYLKIGERKVPLKAIEKYTNFLYVWIKNKERAREEAIKQISESVSVIEYTGGSVVWEIDDVDIRGNKNE